MTVCAHISPARYVPGNFEHSTANIWKNLSGGFDDYYIFARSTNDGRVSRKSNITQILMRSFFSRELEFFFTQFFLFFRILSVRPNVIVSQHPVLGGIVAVLISRRYKIPCLIEIHGAELTRLDSSSLKDRFLRFTAGYSYLRATKIRVLTVGMRNDLLNLYPFLDDEKVVVLPPRVDISRFSPKLKHIRSENPSLIMVGKINRNKGQLRLIRSLLNIGFKGSLTLIGDGPELDDCLLISEKIDAFSIEFKGLVPPSDVSELLKNSDIFVMNSRSEGLPRAILEAMAIGLPVICTDAGYCSDLVKNHETGILLRLDYDDHELMDAIQFLLSNPQSQMEYIQLAKRDITNHYESVKNYEKYISILHEMVG